MRKFILFLTFLLLFVSPCWAATYYVDNSGCGDCPDYRVVQRDCGSGTEQNYDTVAEGETAASTAGDIVYIRTGTYTEHVTFNDDGAEGNYITFEAYNSEVVTLQFGSGTAATWVGGTATWLKFVGIIFSDSGTAERALSIYDASNIYFDSCEFVNGLYGAFNITPDTGARSVTNITLVGCKMRNSAGEGIYLSQDWSTNIITNVLFENCEIYDNRESFEVKSQTGGRQGPDQVTFRGCEIYDNAGGGTWVFGGFTKCTNFVFEDNLVHDNDGSKYGGLQVSAPDLYSTGIIRNNLFYDNGSDSSQSIAASIYIENADNDAGSLVYVYHNTIYGHEDSGITVDGTSDVAGVIIKNNIISGCGDYQILTDGAADCTADYNVRYGGSADKTGANDQTGDPRFISVADGSENLHLEADSCAIDTGTDLGNTYKLDLDDSDQYDDGRWDIGAYRFKKAGGE